MEVCTGIRSSDCANHACCPLDGHASIPNEVDHVEKIKMDLLVSDAWRALRPLPLNIVIVRHNCIFTWKADRERRSWNCSMRAPLHIIMVLEFHIDFSLPQNIFLWHELCRQLKYHMGLKRLYTLGYYSRFELSSAWQVDKTLLKRRNSQGKV